MAINTKQFNLISLGCPKNRVDAERILAVMSHAGFVYTHDAAAAEVIVINTCAFIVSAVEESIAAILDIRAENSRAFLIVAGCLPQRYGEDLRESLPEVNLFVTPDQIRDLPRIVHSALSPESESSSQRLHGPLLSPGARILTTRGYAYLRIAEGCSRCCTYCTIPSIRGPLQSFDPTDMEQEALTLASQGVRELVLVAQDLTSYGTDRQEKKALIRLLQRIGKIEGIRWVRLMYLHPDGVPRDLPRIIRESETILRYLDIPIQHVSGTVLRAMGRPWKGDRIRKLVDRLRSEIPGLVLRTTLMVGFPGEGDKEFRELMDFVKAYSIERVGVFTYSPEDDTPALALGDPVPNKVKQQRADEIREIHSKFSTRRNRGKIGTHQQALVEGSSDESEFLLQGRTWDQAPEIDGVLYITAGTAVAGEIHKVRITGAHGADLFGEIE